jgi:uncharacterized protein
MVKLSTSKMKQRIIGFDLARAYAIFGMYIVNYNTVFGSHTNNSLLGKFLSMFNGNSSSVFVLLAGMGIALMTNRAHFEPEEKKKLRGIISKRSLFLFVIGILFYTWWPADILHYYGGYMHIAIFLLFVNKRYYLITSVLIIIIFHSLLFAIPYQTGWNFDTLEYKDFWTVDGFLRNTFYNGWNSIFPWAAYFMVGMYLGRLQWENIRIQKNIFSIGLLMFILITLLQFYSTQIFNSKDVLFYINADYLPAFIPFMLSTIGFGLMLISFFMYVGLKVANNKFAQNLAKIGQMTLTHYISHLTIGMIIFAIITGENSVSQLGSQLPVKPFYILAFTFIYFFLSFYFSKLWLNKFKNGPIETLMRKISG